MHLEDWMSLPITNGVGLIIIALLVVIAFLQVINHHSSDDGFSFGLKKNNLPLKEDGTIDYLAIREKCKETEAVAYSHYVNDTLKTIKELRDNGQTEESSKKMLELITLNKEVQETKL